MARKLRMQYPGPIYHLMNRGDHQERIFCDDADWKMFLASLAEGCDKTGWQVHSYCLMTNHLHLVKMLEYIQEQRGKWHYGAELSESAEAKAERLITQAPGVGGITQAQLASWRKGHPFKVELAVKLRAVKGS
jgi:hypothetical protein